VVHLSADRRPGLEPHGAALRDLLSTTARTSRFRTTTPSIQEAQAYLADPVLGPRLKACTEAANGHQGRSAHAIFGSPDDMKFRSSMTLFGEATPAEPAFRTALDRYFGGKRDPLTLSRLGHR
jgi:uncharacterized protein (DUF1810 family)